MKNFFPNISVRHKLTFAIMTASLLVLVLVSGAYVVAEIYSSRTDLVRETATLANSLGENSRQLLQLNQFAAAEKVLSSLKRQPNIHAAYLFDEAGKPVAEYLDQFDSRFLLKYIPIDFAEQNSGFWSDSSSNQLSGDWNHLGLFMPIFHGEQRIGTLYLLSDMQGLHGRLSGVFFGVLLALALLALCSWWLSGQLQKPVSRPLLALVETMGLISSQKDYSLRATKQGQDEIGALVDGFNRMLDQIERHRSELEAHQDSLERTVLQRTADLRSTVKQLDLAKQQAEAASEAKSQFLATITHELRTPLIGVLGMNELLFRTAMSEQQEMLAKTVQRSGEDLLKLINDVLDFSRIEAGKLELEEKEFELYRVVENAVNLLCPQATDKGLKIFTEIPLETTWTVRGDEQRVQQIVMNLLGNAIKFTDTGEIHVRLALEQQGESSGVFTVEIQDTGIGMDPETQQRIFSAFYQADSSNTREYAGTGLGLGIVRQLLELMAGRIEFESAPSQGSRFSVSLPLPLVAQGQFDIPAQLRRQQVLVQEDDPRSRELLLQCLTSLGLQPVEATSVTDAWYRLNAAQRSVQPFPLMILSASATLPDGQKLLEALRTHESASSLRRILLLAGQADGGQQKMTETRLYRPMSWGKLVEALNKSWHELRLVQNRTQPERLMPTPAAEQREQLPLALLGGGVASRELIRMALRRTPFAVEVVASLEQLIQQQKDRHYKAVVLDLAAIELDKLAKLLQVQPLSNLILLHQPTDRVEHLRPLVAGLLTKPFQPEQLQQLLAPVVEAAEQNSRGWEGA